MKVPALVCKNCHRPIPLPPAVDPAPEQPSWPGRYTEVGFLCATCKHAYVYSLHDVRESEVGEPSLADKVQNIFCIDVHCWWEGDCEGLVATRALMAFDADANDRASALLHQATAHGIRCTREHFLSGPIPPFGFRDGVHFDGAWKPGNV